MITLFRSDQTCTIDELKKKVGDQLKKLPRIIEPVGTPLMVLRYEFPCEKFDPFIWLRAQPRGPKMYWSDRKGSYQVAGIGVADLVRAQTHGSYKDILFACEDRLSSENPHLRYYGGFSFVQKDSSKELTWRNFDQAYFFIPRFELAVENSKHVFAVNIAAKDITQDSINQLVKELETTYFPKVTPELKLPAIKSRRDYPNGEEWSDIFKKVITAIKQKDYEKVVLARKTLLELEGVIDPMTLMEYLQKQTPHCFHFCFQFNDTTAFLGASPECLYERKNQQLLTEAIAGTKPRGENKILDEQFKEGLLNNPKELREHKIVVDGIEKSLKDICRQLEFDNEAALLKLKSGHHLVTRFKGLLKESVTDHQIFERLHPTAAVCGQPTTKALEVIEMFEPFDRGWYAAPVGYIGHDDVQFAVAIRSALVEGNKLALYSGAGIVEGSLAQGEWEEIEGKIKTFLELLTKR